MYSLARPFTSQTWKKWEALQGLLEDFNPKFARAMDLFYCKMYAKMSRIQLFLKNVPKFLKPSHFIQNECPQSLKSLDIFGN